LSREMHLTSLEQRSLLIDQSPGLSFRKADFKKAG
jgi:hypothetical protein